MILTTIGLLVVAVPLVVGSALLAVMWRSWWLFPAWSWFIVPLGVTPIAFWHFAALLLLTDTFRHISTKKDERETEWASVGVSFLWPIVVWVLLRWMR